jgi:hypothetical protein
MSGDGGAEVDIAAAFLHRNDGRRIIGALQHGRKLLITMRGMRDCGSGVVLLVTTPRSC